MVRVRYSFGSRHTGRIKNIKKQRGKYPDVMKDVVRISDIVLEILDARYVDEMRNVEVEKDVLAKGKVLVYVLNKCDLVSRKDVEKKLSKEMRPFVFVSATKGAGIRDLKAKIKMEAKRLLVARKSARGVGVGGMGVLDSKGKVKVKDDSIVKDLGGKKRIHVGVIGYPNAGKSSVINMITRRGVAKTAKQAGFTKGMQKIRMSEGILILDTPGVIPASEYSSEAGSFAKDVKVGARSAGDVRDPEGAVAFLMVAPEPVDVENVTEGEQVRINEADKNAMAIWGFYGIDVADDVEKFIEELGKKKGFLGKGGVVDVDRTARLILRDWQEGRIGTEK